ncbi:MAG: UDP-N-acetylglucosamine--N-acetylmuramyl-(pentapeptide) pyrophosphoryl-undecaprenol N-acetylglucosamine transferase [Puniceicoccales bacterium]|nr:UDP-N-acetylglucosamine--N-acetylmuramyl-(pentapeptide) pyrophosphoryl-undecaprenol N-acetylglucosamine transferase [Puniceicoccales bacterium]
MRRPIDHRYFADAAAEGAAEGCDPAETVRDPIKAGLAPAGTGQVFAEGGQIPAKEGQILIACGGTGGHVVPGIALAQRLCAIGRSSLLAISGKSVDGQFCQSYPNIAFLVLPGSGFSLKPRVLLRAAWGALRSFVICLRLIRKHSVAGVVSFGGFTAFGPCLAAFFLRRPIFLCEVNQRPGKAVRLFAPIASRIYVPHALKNSTALAKKRRHVAMEYPLRSDFIPCGRGEARRRLALPLEENLLLVMGGSQGARVLVDWAAANGQQLAAAGWHGICLTGLGGWERKVFSRGRGGTFYFLTYFPFCHAMHLLLSAVDLAICRAGAGTIAELTACATPSFLVPYPHAANGHQTANALAMERNGAAIHLPQEQLGKLLNRIGEWEHSKEREVMEKNLLKLRMKMANGAEKLAVSIEEGLRR